MFNLIAHADWAPPLDGARVIDLFAGSGALGARGHVARRRVLRIRGKRFRRARHDPRQLRNAGPVRINPHPAPLGHRPWPHPGRRRARPFTIAFLDPPYHKGLVEPALAQLAKGGWLAEDAIAIVETAADEALAFPGWELLDERTYGAAKVSFLKQALGVEEFRPQVEIGCLRADMMGVISQPVIGCHPTLVAQGR